VTEANLSLAPVTDSSWTGGPYTESREDEDYQHLNSSSAESESHDPDKYLLLDEL
jgi:hypothetical protein